MPKTRGAGCAGALFQMAKTNMTDSAVSQVSDSVPEMTGLLGAVPQAKPASSAGDLLGALASATALANTFQQLDLKKGMISQFAPVLVNYVKQSGGDVTATLSRHSCRLPSQSWALA